MRTILWGFLLVTVLGGCADAKKLYEKITAPETPAPVQPTEPQP